MMKLKYKEEMVDTLLFEECVDMVNNGERWQMQALQYWIRMVMR